MFERLLKLRGNLLEQLLKVNAEKYVKREINASLKDELLDGAITLFKEKGIDKVTTRELTDLIGISRSHIYHYFKDWRSLSIAACARFMYHEYQQTAEEVATLSPPQALQRLIAEFLPLSDDPSWPLYMDIWRLAQHNEAYSELTAGIIHEWDRLMESIIQAGIQQAWYKPVDAARVARQLGALINGYADILLFPTPLHSREQAIDEINEVRDLLLAPANGKLQ